MRNRTLVRIQLLLLVSLVILIVWRFSAGPRIGEGFVQIQPSDLGQLDEVSFTVERPTSIHVRAVGAFETDEAGAPLAAYGWVLDRSNAQVVWSMETFRVDRDGVLASADDSLRLAPGSYTAYFTSFGPTPSSREQRAFLGLKPHWTNHRDAFHLVLSTRDSDEDAIRSGMTVTAESGDATSTPLWSALRVSNRKTMEELVRVDSDAGLRIQAIIGLCSSGCDMAYIEDLDTGATVWEMSMENTVAAGGWEANRLFDDIIRLGEGIYRFVLTTDRRHSWNRWSANTPYNPEGFGMQVEVVSGSAVTLDPTAGDARLVSMVDIGSSEHRTMRMRVSERTLVLVDAMGEISSNGTLYDYGYIVRDSNGERVWRMSLDKSVPAGGHETNRQERAVVRLDAGEYTLHYETDDSHAFGDWRKDRPRETDRWGMTLYLLSGTPGSVSILEDSAASAPASVSAPTHAPITRSDVGPLLAGLHEAGNDTRFEQPFQLTAATTVHVEAMGEVSTNGRYDYGWIERADTGERVWEMTLENTVHAGGDDRNRMFDGAVSLPAGEYVVHYISDFNHAFGDYGDGPPTQAADWGIRIYNPLP
ncbi:MAG: hypothetical protein RIE53_05905 [Rhodothermales bacterium]